MGEAHNAQGLELQKDLARLDLYHHSLRLVGKKLASSAGVSRVGESEAIYARSLELGEHCALALRGLKQRLPSEDVDYCDAALERIDRAMGRATLAKGHTLFTMSVWRIVEAVEQFLGRVALRYGYRPLSDLAVLEGERAAPGGIAQIAPTSGRYERTVAELVESVGRPAVMIFPAVPRYRLRRLLRPGLLAGFAVILAFVAVSVGAPILAPPEGDDPYTMPRSSYKINPEPPRSGYPLGTTERSFDVFHGIVWGTHIAFRIGLSVTAGRLLIGMVVGLVSGYYGGWLDALIMRITDAFLAFPIVPATLVMLAFFGPRTLGRVASASGVDSIIILSLILFGWMQYARLVRGNVLAERAKQYVEAAVSIGAAGRHIIWRHVLPNIPQGLFVLAASDVGAMVVLAAVFTFLGLSGRAGLADWGWMLNIGRTWIIGTPSNAFQYWYTYLPPIAAIVLFSVGWNLIGDGLRDVMDPRTR
jgi:peptide/nickel transport system permease protein